MSFSILCGCYSNTFHRRGLCVSCQDTCLAATPLHAAHPTFGSQPKHIVLIKTMSQDIIQEIFDTISLQSNIGLWISCDDARFEERFLHLHKRSVDFFLDAIEKNSVLEGKNAKLSGAFFEKSLLFLENGNEEKYFQCVNKALSLADEPNSIPILKQRLKFSFDRCMYKESLDDIYELRYVVENKDIYLVLEFDCYMALDNMDNNANSKNYKTEDMLIGFCNNVEVVSSEEFGRHVVATRDILPGERLATDDPRVVMLCKKYVSTHCWYCFSKLGPVKHHCHDCCYVAFCSSSCKRCCMKQFHGAECRMLGTIHGTNIGCWTLAFRAFHMNDLDQEEGLISHIGTNELSAPELMKEAMIAVFFTVLFTWKQLISHENMLDCGHRIRKWLRISKYNAHEVVHEENGHILVVGHALNPRLALLNHSCDPNYGRIWIGQKPLAFATRPIRQGEEVCDSYSGIYAFSPMTERQNVHKQYLFQCGCVACENNWQMFDKLPDNCRFKSQRKVRTLDGLKKLVINAHSELQSPHRFLIEIEKSLHQAIREHYKHVHLEFKKTSDNK